MHMGVWSSSGACSVAAVWITSLSRNLHRLGGKRVWQGVPGSGGETPPRPLQWLVHTFIFYRPHDSLSLPRLSSIGTHTPRVSLHPKTITTRMQCMEWLCSHTHAYTIFPADSDNKTGESVWAWQQTNQHEESPSRLKREHNQSYKNAPATAHFFSIDRGREYAQCCSRPELLVIRMGSEGRQAVEWMQMNSLAPAQGSTTSLFI